MNEPRNSPRNRRTPLGISVSREGRAWARTFKSCATSPLLVILILVLLTYFGFIQEDRFLRIWRAFLSTMGGIL